jgi:hypothetical protein
VPLPLFRARLCRRAALAWESAARLFGGIIITSWIYAMKRGSVGIVYGQIRASRLDDSKFRFNSSLLINPQHQETIAILLIH